MDIIFLAAIALFIFFRLKDQLGKISDEEKDSIAQKIKLQQQQILEAQKNREKESFLQKNILEKSEETPDEENNIDKKHIKDLDQNAIDNLTKIFSKFDIDSEFFITGARAAFEMTLDSFASHDLETLELLLSEKLYKGFEKLIKDRQKNGETLNTQIISVDDGKIIAANIDQNKAFITVEFSSKQINYLADKKDEITQGSKEQINELKDIWTFKKDLNDDSPNWKISATG